MFMAFSMFPRLHHLTYDPWIWLKVTSLSSTASVLKDGRISLEISSSYSIFFSKHQNEVIVAISLSISKCLSGSKNISYLNDHQM